MADVRRCGKCGAELTLSDAEGLCPCCLLELAFVDESRSDSGDKALQPLSEPAAMAASPVGAPGTRVGPYEIVSLIGRGGMGEVYRARDRRLDRDVAIKLLPPAYSADPDRLRRFEQEARAAGILNHPAVLAVYDVGAHDGAPYIVSELLEGETLRERLCAGPLPVAEAVEYALQVARGMGTAHERGILHRDLKPENLFLTRDGRIKILDFGLAKLRDAEPVGGAESTVTTVGLSTAGLRLGTPGYMSPEQATGQPVGAFSDVFSLGAVLFEMLTGRRLVEGDRYAALLNNPPRPIDPLPHLPADLDRILRRTLANDPQARYPDAGALARDLAACQAQLSAGRRRLSARERRLAWAGMSLLVVLTGVSLWLWRDRTRATWARTVALPEIERLGGERERVIDAYRLLREVERILPGDTQAEAVAGLFTVRGSIQTIPSGAQVAIRDYLPRADDPGWIVLGSAPLSNVRIPIGYLRWRITRDGYEPAEFGRAPVEGGVLGGHPVIRNFDFVLEPAGRGRSGMVLVPPGDAQGIGGHLVRLPAFHIDRFEVTNWQFKAFIDARAYERPEFWRQPFEIDGRVLPFDQAVSRFRDSTGYAGPARWTLGSFPDGEADFPVSGISWFEAAAYAGFAGKRLPTVYEWDRASGMGVFHDIVLASNFDGPGPAPVGSYRGLGPYGTHDMAGNVKEWCWNRAGTKRYIRGGSWIEPTYRFSDFDAQSPWAREATHGFRCVSSIGPPPAEALAPIEPRRRDFSAERPPSDLVFAAYRSFYRYDRTPVEGRIDSIDDSSPHVRIERVSFAAAYDRERVPAVLFLPKHARPPLQVVIYFPAINALWERSSARVHSPRVDYVVRSGRAVLLPIYKGTYERGYPSPARGPAESRERFVRFYQDLARAIDYIESRRDLDAEKVAYFGFSLGVDVGTILMAVEPRLKTGVFLAGGAGIWPGANNPFGHYDPPIREMDPMSFASRVSAPVLMVNGVNDFIFPVAESQRPLFDRLGTPPAHKRHVVLPGGHVPDSLRESMTEIVNWLDKYLGRVQR